MQNSVFQTESETMERYISRRPRDYMNTTFLAIFFGLSQCGQTGGAENNIASLIKEGTEYIEKIQNLWSSNNLFPADGKSKSKNQ